MAKQSFLVQGVKAGVEAGMKAYIDKKFDELLEAMSLHMVYRANHLVTVTDAARGFVKIGTGLPVIHGKVIQIFRRNQIVTGDAICEIMTGGNLIIESGPEDYTLQNGDVISWVCW